MTDARQRIETARARIAEQQKQQHEQELRVLINEVEAEFGFTDEAPDVEPEKQEPDAKTLANAVRINGRTGGHAPQMKRAARYIDASNR